jgi:hypothetical protein
MRCSNRFFRSREVSGFSASPCLHSRRKTSNASLNSACLPRLVLAVKKGASATPEFPRFKRQSARSRWGHYFSRFRPAALTGQQVISSDGNSASRAFRSDGTAGPNSMASTPRLGSPTCCAVSPIIRPLSCTSCCRGIGSNAKSLPLPPDNPPSRPWPDGCVLNSSRSSGRMCFLAIARLQLWRRESYLGRRSRIGARPFLYSPKSRSQVIIWAASRAKVGHQRLRSGGTIPTRTAAQEQYSLRNIAILDLARAAKNGSRVSHRPGRCRSRNRG